MYRREFLKNSGAALCGLPFLGLPWPGAQNLSGKSPALELHIFSKHLQFLNWEAAAEVASNLGFDGLDLTVRPGGHVAPEKVKEQLPLAVEAIQKGGSGCKLITTAVEKATNEQDRAVLESAAGQGVTHYRCNWFSYSPDTPMKDSLAMYREQIMGLAELNRQLGLVGCYQNHAGHLIGASLWEVARLLEGADPQSFGVQYDIRHATVEGGLSWENGLRLVQDRIKTLVLKDFKWEKKEGEWQVVNTPIGEGMVDFTRYFKLLKQYGIFVPASLHLEYPLGGAEHGATSLQTAPENVFAAMEHDLNTVKELWEKA